MTPDFAEWDLDGEVVFDRYLGAGDDLDTFQELLRELAPKWSSKLRVWMAPRDQRPIDVRQPGALRAAVVAAAGERGATYHKLVQQHGKPEFERLTGSAELRGAGPEMDVIVSVDEMVVSSLGPKVQLGNSITLQVRRAKLERTPGRDWLASMFEALCAGTSPAWGSVWHAREYWAKVMSDPPGAAAIGRDFGRFLPGVFWMNYFGRPYLQLLGEDRILSTPAERVASVGDGVLVSLGNAPTAWDTLEQVTREQRVRDHLGVELFFSKSEPDRRTVAPDWGKAR